MIKFNLSTKTFYLIGFSCFGISFLMGCINLGIYWNINNFFSHVSTIANLVFGLAITLLFLKMYKELPKGEVSSIDKETIDALKEVENWKKEEK